MDIVIASLSDQIPVFIPVNFILWGMVMAYVLHILEESILPEVFVDKVKRLYFPGYDWVHFFGFNTFLLTLNITAVIVYESAWGSWIIFPLSLAMERIFNGFYHLVETITAKKFSSGLLSSVIFWILGYLLVRYALLPGEITVTQFVVSAIIGFAIFALMIFPLTLGAFRNYTFPGGD